MIIFAFGKTLFGITKKVALGAKKIAESAAGEYVERFTFGAYKLNKQPDGSLGDLEPLDLDEGSSGSGSDSSSDDFGLECGQITETVEEFVDDNWKECDPISSVFGPSTAEVISSGVQHAKEESECVGMHLFKSISDAGFDDEDALVTCANVAYWCCCEKLQNVSPIIAAATLNLFF